MRGGLKAASSGDVSAIIYDDDWFASDNNHLSNANGRFSANMARLLFMYSLWFEYTVVINAGMGIRGVVHEVLW